MGLVVLMERLISSVRVLIHKQQDISLYRQFMKGFWNYYLSECRGLVIKKLHSQTGGSRPTECLSKETYLLNIYLALQFKVKDLDLEYFLLRFPDSTLHQEVPKLFSQQALRGVVDKTTAQKPKIQQFETDHLQRLRFRKFSVKIPRPHNS